MRTTVALLALAAAASASHVDANELKLLWNTWKSLHNKAYTESQEVHKFTAFVQNYMKVVTNNNENSDVKLALNQFADLTEEEWRAQFVSGIPHGEIVPQEHNGIDYSILSAPASVDWRTKGAVTPVKNQKSCGSCWAFSTTGALESFNFINNGKLLSLSEQQFVDCEKDNWGCGGGWMHQALAYAGQNGVETEADYPYTARDGACKYNAAKAQHVNHGIRNVTFNDADALKAAIAAQPVSIVIGVDGIMQHYKSGVVHKCTKATQHGVLAVGYGTVQGEEAYIVKNSWDTTWGDKGYFYLSTDPKPNGGAGVCGVLQLPSVPTL